MSLECGARLARCERWDLMVSGVVEVVQDAFPTVFVM